jgi:hypothetical protein
MEKKGETYGPTCHCVEKEQSIVLFFVSMLERYFSSKEL